MVERRCYSCGCEIPKGRRYCDICWANELYQYNKALAKYEKELDDYNNLPDKQKAAVDGKAQRLFNKGLTVFFFFALMSFDFVLMSFYGVKVYLCALLLLIIGLCVFSTIKLYNVFGKITQLLIFMVIGNRIFYVLIGQAIFTLIFKVDATAVEAMSFSEKFKDWRIGLVYVLSQLIGIAIGAYLGSKFKVSGRPRPPKKPNNCL